MSKSPWKTLSKETKYKTPWIEVVHHEVITPGGNPGIYGCVNFQNIAVGIIALDEDLNTWIVGQFRYPLQRYTWEIPEGGCPLGEEPLEGAKRELKEEVGIEAEEWHLIQEMDLSNSATDEISYTFVAKQLTIGASYQEENEDITIKKLPFSELYQMVIKGEIRDAISVAGVLRVKQMIDDQLL
jgi:8-oxo-dGTP pyrophosphatase MutT (NUDIX family)